jgi:ATP-dependent DNA helicase RecQ
MEHLQLERLAQSIFQIETLKPYQVAIIDDVLAQKDLLIILPTGSGKSLCYQLPGLILAGCYIVVSPLIALMEEQVFKLKAKNIQAEFIHGGLSPERIQNILSQAKTAELKFLYLTPERLLQTKFLNELSQINISGFAIDEAHCILHWGQDFRPEYQRLSLLKTKFPKIPIMALTATATTKQQNFICQKLKLMATKHVYPVYKPNIQFKILAQNQQKTSIFEILNQHYNQTGIIYCASQKRVELIYQTLKNADFNVLAYHAGMGYQQREEAHQAFHHQEANIMVATLAFGMGVDKPNIRFIIHLDAPGRLDQFIQESGRAGRDSQLAHHYVIYHPYQFLLFNLWRIQKAKPAIQTELLDDLKIMSRFLSEIQCFPQLIHEYFEEQYLTNCDNCSPCQKQQLSDQSLDFQKLISCIYHLKQQAAWEDVVDVLLARAPEWEHLSTYGIGRDRSKQDWYNLLIQLFAQNLIQLKTLPHPHWCISNEGAKWLKQQTI